jgi:hypothetical protein
MAAALEAVHHDADPESVAEAARRAARGAGGADVELTLDLDRPGPLRKGGLVRVRLRCTDAEGRGVAVARTFVVGFDSFEPQVEAGRRATRAAAGAAAQLVPGLPLAAIPTAAPGLVIAVQALRPGAQENRPDGGVPWTPWVQAPSDPASGGTTAELPSGTVEASTRYYIEVDAKVEGLAGDVLAASVWLGETWVTSEGDGAPEPITQFARRLWV